MRNLKKILALVLALVMSLSLMATAGAADTTASGETITPAYQTAIDVLKGVEVFRGYEDGTIRPQSYITRAEVAAILYRIATGDVNDTKKDIYTDMANTKFTDLANATWAAGYINYCANAELIVGMGDGTFKPQQNITGYATLAMVLRALGYDKNNEFKGSGWEIRTASKARELGVLKNVTTDELGSYATRELVSELLFRTILNETVTYSPINQDGYRKTGKTLAEQTLGLYEQKGVVMANEYAHLEDNETLDDGETLLVNETRSLIIDQTTTLDDIGETRLAYIQDANPNDTTPGKVLAMDGTGLNNAKDTVEKMQLSALLKEAGLKATDEKFINFAKTGLCTSEYKIKYVLKFDTAADADAAMVEIKTETNGIVEKDSAVAVAVTLKPGTVITSADRGYIKGIFSGADRFEDLGYINGEVYVGTQSLEDISDDYAYSYSKFEDQFLIFTEEAAFTANEAGNWMKVIDNDLDGTADYIFKVVYTVAQVAREKDGTVTLDTKNHTLRTTSGICGNDEMNNLTSEGVHANDFTPAKGDVVYYAIIDGKAQTYKCDTVTAKIEKVDHNKLIAYTVDGAEYPESGVHEHIEDEAYTSGVTNLAGQVSYELYLDRGENLAAFVKTDKVGDFQLITDGWYNRLKANKEFAVRVYNDETGKQDIVDIDTNASLFVFDDVNEDIQNNNWNALKWFGGVNDGDKRLAALNGDGKEVHTTVAAITAEGTILPVENSGVTGRYDHAMIDLMIDTNGDGKAEIPAKVPTRAAVDGIVYETMESAATETAYNNKVDGPVDVRALASTVYYVVYPDKSTVSGLNVIRTEGYSKAPDLDDFADTVRGSWVEDVYAVGTLHEADNALTGKPYYNADVVVVELNYYENDGDIVFVVDDNARYTDVRYRDVTVIDSEGAVKQVKVDHWKNTMGYSDNADGGKKIVPGLYWIKETVEDDIFYLTRMTPAEIRDSKRIAVGQIDLAQWQKDSDYIVTQNWSEDTLAAGLHNGINEIGVYSQADVNANTDEGQYTLTDKTALFKLAYGPKWDDAGYTLDDDNDTVLDGMVNQMYKNNGTREGSKVLNNQNNNTVWYNYNDVLVFYGNKNTAVYVVSFENFLSDTSDKMDAAQIIWEGIIPAGTGTVTPPPTITTITGATAALTTNTIEVGDALPGYTITSAPVNGGVKEVSHKWVDAAGAETTDPAAVAGTYNLIVTVEAANSNFVLAGGVATMDTAPVTLTVTEKQTPPTPPQTSVKVLATFTMDNLEPSNPDEINWSAPKEFDLDKTVTPNKIVLTANDIFDTTDYAGVTIATVVADGKTITPDETTGNYEIEITDATQTVNLKVDLHLNFNGSTRSVSETSARVNQTLAVDDPVTKTGLVLTNAGQKPDPTGKGCLVFGGPKTMIVKWADAEKKYAIPGGWQVWEVEYTIDKDEYDELFAKDPNFLDNIRVVAKGVTIDTTTIGAYKDTAMEKIDKIIEEQLVGADETRRKTYAELRANTRKEIYSDGVTTETQVDDLVAIATLILENQAPTANLGVGALFAPTQWEGPGLAEYYYYLGTSSSEESLTAAKLLEMLKISGLEDANGKKYTVTGIQTGSFIGEKIDGRNGIASPDTDIDKDHQAVVETVDADGNTQTFTLLLVRVYRITVNGQLAGYVTGGLYNGETYSFDDRGTVVPGYTTAVNYLEEATKAQVNPDAMGGVNINGTTGLAASEYAMVNNADAGDDSAPNYDQDENELTPVPLALVQTEVVLNWGDTINYTYSYDDKDFVTAYEVSVGLNMTGWTEDVEDKDGDKEPVYFVEDDEADPTEKICYVQNGVNVYARVDEEIGENCPDYGVGTHEGCESGKGYLVYTVNDEEKLVKDGNSTVYGLLDALTAAPIDAETITKDTDIRYVYGTLVKVDSVNKAVVNPYHARDIELDKKWYIPANLPILSGVLTGSLAFTDAGALSLLKNAGWTTNSVMNLTAAAQVTFPIGEFLRITVSNANTTTPIVVTAENTTGGVGYVAVPSTVTLENLTNKDIQVTVNNKSTVILPTNGTAEVKVDTSDDYVIEVPNVIQRINLLDLSDKTTTKASWTTDAADDLIGLITSNKGEALYKNLGEPDDDTDDNPIAKVEVSDMFIYGGTGIVKESADCSLLGSAALEGGERVIMTVKMTAAQGYYFGNPANVEGVGDWCNVPPAGNNPATGEAYVKPVVNDGGMTLTFQIEYVVTGGTGGGDDSDKPSGADYKAAIDAIDTELAKSVVSGAYTLDELKAKLTTEIGNLTDAIYACDTKDDLTDIYDSAKSEFNPENATVKALFDKVVTEAKSLVDDAATAAIANINTDPGGTTSDQDDEIAAAKNVFDAQMQIADSVEDYTKAWDTFWAVIKDMPTKD